MSNPIISISKIHELESKLSNVIDVLKHQGEAGRNIESIVKEILLEYIPGKYGVETGFVRSLEDPNWESHQTDILFTYKDSTHPLAVFPGSKVFPLEAIIGFMEITKHLTRDKLFLDFEKVSSLKHKTKRCYSMPLNIARGYGYLEKLKDPTPEELLKDRIYRCRVELSDLQPRFFYFAFTSEWKKRTTVCKNLAEVGLKYNIHLHGMLVLDSGYYKHIPRESEKKPYGVMYIDKMPDAFIVFIHDLIDSLQTFSVPPPSSSILVTEYGLIKPSYKKYEYNK